MAQDMAAVKSPEWVEGFNHAMTVVGFWLEFQPEGKIDLDRRTVGMMKSALLGRLMRGEEIRRRPCPKHRGRMWCGWGFGEDYSCCGGTGWLPNEKEEEN